MPETRRGAAPPVGRYTPDAPPRLTPMQATIVELLAAGLTRREIARAIGRSPETVKTHVRHVAEKLPGTGNVWARAARYVALREVEPQRSP